MIFVSYTAQGKATRMLMFCRIGHASKPTASIVSTKKKKMGQKMRPACQMKCVVNVTQTQVSEGPRSQSATPVREVKEVKGVDQPEDEQLSVRTTTLSKHFRFESRNGLPRRASSHH